jgi:hypothetical protein
MTTSGDDKSAGRPRRGGGTIPPVGGGPCPQQPLRDAALSDLFTILAPALDVLCGRSDEGSGK